MSGLEFYRRKPGAWLEMMEGLTLEERGALTAMVDLFFDRGGPVFDDERRLAAKMDCDVRVWRRVRDQLMAKGALVAAPGGLACPMAVELLAETLDRLQLARTSGAAGGQAKAKSTRKPNENSEGDLATVCLTEDRREETLAKPIPEPESAPLGAQAREEISVEDMARRIYDALPTLSRMKTGHDSLRIRRAIEARVALGESARTVAAAAYRYATDRAQQRENGKFAAQLHKLIEVGFPPLWIQSGKTLAVPETLGGRPLIWTPPTGPIAPPAPAPPHSLVTVAGHAFEIPDGEEGLHTLAAELRVKRQLEIMAEWVDLGGRPQQWQRDSWGPPPGDPRSRIWPSVAVFCQGDRRQVA